MSDKNISKHNEEIKENLLSNSSLTEVNKLSLFVVKNPTKKETDSTFNTSALIDQKFQSQVSIPNESIEAINNNEIINNEGPKTTKNLFVVYKDVKEKKRGKKRSPYNLVNSDIRKLIIKEALRGRLLKSISEEFQINYSTIKTIWAIYRDEMRTERKRGIKKSFTQNIKNIGAKKFDSSEKESRKNKLFKNFHFVENNSSKSSGSETDEDVKNVIENKTIKKKSVVIESNKNETNSNYDSSIKVLNKKRLKSEVNVRKYLKNNSELSLFTIQSQNSSSNSKENNTNGKRSNSSNFTCNYSLDDEGENSSKENAENAKNVRKKDNQKTCTNLTKQNEKESNYNKMLVDQSIQNSSNKFSSKEDILSSDTKINKKENKTYHQKSSNRLNFTNKYKNMIDNDFDIFTVKKTHSSNQVLRGNKMKIDLENDFLFLNENNDKQKRNRNKKRSQGEKYKFSPDFINKFETNLSLNTIDNHNHNNIDIEHILKQVMNHENQAKYKSNSDNLQIINDDFISGFLKSSKDFKNILLNSNLNSKNDSLDEKLFKFKDLAEKFSNFQNIQSKSNIIQGDEINDFFSKAINKGKKLDQINSILKQYENQINSTLNSKNSSLNSLSDLKVFDSLNNELENINKTFLSMFNKSSNLDVMEMEDNNKENVQAEKNLLNFDQRCTDKNIGNDDWKKIHTISKLEDNFDIADFLSIIEKKYKQFESIVQSKILTKEIEDNTFCNLNSSNQAKLHFLFTFNYFYEFLKVNSINNEDFNEFFILMLSYLELLKNKCWEEEDEEA